MTEWTSDELEKIGTAEQLEIAALRPDGTSTKPVTIWVVRVGENLYVRSYKGRDGAWFRAVKRRHEGSICVSGLDKNVTFVEESDAKIRERIDTEYRSKYGRYNAQYIEPMVAAAASDTTIKLLPR